MLQKLMRQWFRHRGDDIQSLDTPDWYLADSALATKSTLLSQESVLAAQTAGSPVVAAPVATATVAQAGIASSAVVLAAVANSAPTAIKLSATRVAENAIGAVIGKLTVTDPNVGDTHSFNVSDTRFEVVSGQLKLKAGVSLDREAAASVGVTVTATDSGGLSKSQAFTISVTNVNEAPTSVSLSATTVKENAVAAVVGTLSAVDPDKTTSFTYSVNDNRFEVLSGKLRLKAGVSLDYEAEQTVSVDVTAKDAGGLSKTQSFTIQVTNVNEAPTEVQLASSSVAGGVAGAVVGQVSIVDPDAGDSHTLKVSDSRFEIVNGQLQLKNGVSLSADTSSVTLNVTATDSGNLSKTQSFTLDVDSGNTAAGNHYSFGTLGEFAEAAYFRPATPWTASWAQSSFVQLQGDGWTFMNESWGQLYSDGSPLIYERYYGNNPGGSAGAICAVKGDTLVVSFRGTEDFNQIGLIQNAVTYEWWSRYQNASWAWDYAVNDVYTYAQQVGPALAQLLGSPYPPSWQQIHDAAYAQWAPLNDSNYWIQQDFHYDMFQPLVNAIKNYVSDASHGIQHVYVTGHSLGGVMADWYVTDNVNGGGYLKSLGIDVMGAAFGAPGMITDTPNERYFNEDIPYYRFEMKNDAVPDVTDTYGQVSVIHASEPGQQINVYSNLGYGQSDYHWSANYINAAKELDASGFTSNLAYLESGHGNIFNSSTETYDPVVMSQLFNGGAALGTYAMGDWAAWGGREFSSAEAFTANDVIIGTRGDDTLIGDATEPGSGIGSDDVFFAGTCLYGDVIYGDLSYQDYGGIDTAVFSGDLNQYVVNTVAANGSYTNNHSVQSLDGTTDVVLYGVEYLVFNNKQYLADTFVSVM